MPADPPERPPLDRSRLQALGHGLGHGLGIEVVDAAPSTNALVAERARRGAAEGLVVVAEHQTAGRGRVSRVWETPARAALTLSVLLRPDLPPVRWPWLPLLTGYAVGRALRAEGHDAGLKWPNDVLIAGRKVAGILVERVETREGPAAVLGIGINVTTTRAELPVEHATSLALEGGAPDRTELLRRLLPVLLEAYADWRDGGEPAAGRLRAAYTAACVTLGREVRVDLPSGEVLTGRAAGIDDGGRLLVQGPAGRTAVGAGDVVHVRADHR